MEAGTIREISAGAFHLAGWLSIASQLQIIQLCRTLLDGETPGYTPVVRGGGRMHVRMLCLGRHWNGKAPMLDDHPDIDGQPCAMCGKDIAPDLLVRLRVQKPAGPVKQPTFDEQTLPLHFDCLAVVSTTRFG